VAGFPTNRISRKRAEADWPRLGPSPEYEWDSQTDSNRLDPTSGWHQGWHRRIGHRQVFTRPFRPHTNGKVERFEEWAYVRPYESNEMARRDVELGIAAMCIGGGQGIAMVVDALSTSSSG
jgi:transposase InsO family protein